MAEAKKIEFNPGKILFGVLVIFIGIILLGKSTGLFPVEISFPWWNLWPLLIVFGGLSMLSGKGWLSAVISLAIGLAVIAIVAALLFVNYPKNTSEQTYLISVDKQESATEASIEISTGAGTVDITGGADKLLEGSLVSSFAQPTITSDMNDDIQDVELKMKTEHNFFVIPEKNDLNLELNNDLPLSLSLDTGATDMILDLSEVLAKKVDIDTGASTLDLTFGSLLQEEMEANIDAGAATIMLNIPNNVGLYMNLDSGLTTKDFDKFVKKGEKVYESENYDNTVSKIKLDMNLGATNLEINWIGSEEAQATPEWLAYSSVDKNFSFSYPVGWEKAEGIDNDLLSVDFSDDGQSILQLDSPHYGTGFEMHDVVSTEYFATNDANTKIKMMSLKPTAENIEGNYLALAIWQKGCNTETDAACIDSGDADSGIFIMALGKDEATRNVRLAIMKQILQSFRFE
ncbi:MAG: toast rack family protein [Patescibacteria group bacterium]|jgi:hypothetical protein